MSFETLRFLHIGFSRSAWMFMLILGAWATVHYIQNKPLDGRFFGIVAAGEVLMVLQALVGLTMILTWGIQPGRSVHFLYGTLTVVVFPAIYYYTQGETDRRATLIWALTGLFMFGLALRAISTAFAG